MFFGAYNYTSVYFIMYCLDSDCNAYPRWFDPILFNMSYTSYYFDQQSQVRPSRRSFLLTPGNRHYQLMNLIEQRKTDSVIQLSEDSFEH